jgi:hypothetical protein
MRRLAEADVMAGPTRPPGGTQRSLVIETLGYLGAAIVVAASLLIVARYWGDLDVAWRLTVLGSATLILLGCGAALPTRLSDLGDRLRAVLWTGSTAAGAGFLAVLAVDFLDLQGDDVALLVASGTAAYAAVLWFSRPSFLLQLSMMVTVGVAASAAIAQTPVPDSMSGLGVWVAGLGWALLAWAGLLQPSRWSVTSASAMAIAGAMVTASSDGGIVLTLVTVTAVIAAGAVSRNLPLLGVGLIGLLLNVPQALTRWFPDSLAAAYVLLIVGMLLVVAALWAARRPGGDPDDRQM